MIDPTRVTDAVAAAGFPFEAAHDYGLALPWRVEADTSIDVFAVILAETQKEGWGFSYPIPVGLPVYGPTPPPKEAVTGEVRFRLSTGQTASVALVPCLGIERRNPDGTDAEQ